jgi:hypothetical protein
MADHSLPIISAREAYDAGRTRYFTGKPCKRGHIAERMVTSGSCVECLHVYEELYRSKQYAIVKAWKEANPEKVAEYSKRYAAKHPETHKKAAQKYREIHLEEIRERDRWAHHRIRRINPEAEKARLQRWKDRQSKKLEAMAGRPRPDFCEICGEFHLRIVFDHCHVSGEFRGWLCDRCNKILGLVKDSPDILLALAKYLKGG